MLKIIYQHGKRYMTPKNNFHAEIYDRIYRHKDYAGEVEEIAPYLGKNSLILDIGGGTGNHAIEMRKLGHSAIILDNDPSMIAKAKKKGVRTIPEGAKITDYAKLDGTFDAITALFHVVNFFEEDRPNRFKQIYSLLGKGKNFVFDVWNCDIKKQGFSIKWDWLYTRIIHKRWLFNIVYVEIIYPFLLKGESHQMYCPQITSILQELVQAGFTVENYYKRGMDYVVMATKL